MFHLDHRDGRPIYEQITDGFRHQIRAGVLCSGDKLPSVRELAADLSINPSTIQRAYRELETEGWIVSVPGKGSFVCKSQTPAENDTKKLLESFDDIVRQLNDAGIPSSDLVARLTTHGGEDHA